MSKHTINAIVPWFGGKRTMAPDIVVELGKHTQYFEPFCGSMAVLFAKEQSQKETVNDLHGDLINLARVLQDRDAAEALYQRLGRTLFSEGLLDQARVELDVVSSQVAIENESVEPSPTACDRAYWYFLASWMGRNGTAGTARIDYQIAVRWTKGGGSPTVRFRNAVESIPWWHERLQNVVILRRDAFDILNRFEDCKETAIYCDPPYADETRSKGAIKNGRGGKYLHEFNHGHAFVPSILDSDLCNKCGKPKSEHVTDHERLVACLNEYKHARIVVSYYDSPRIRELYKGWTFVSHARQKHLHAQNGRGARPKEAPEVLIVNGPSYAEVTNG